MVEITKNNYLDCLHIYLELSTDNTTWDNVNMTSKLGCIDILA